MKLLNSVNVVDNGSLTAYSVISTNNMVLKGSSNDYTFSWSNPSAARTINIVDPISSSSQLIIGTITSATNGQVLTYDGSKWVNADPSGSGLTIGSTSISGGTTGSLLYVASGPVLQQKPTNLFFDNTNNRLGINVSSAPQGAIHVIPNNTGTQGLVVSGLSGQSMDLQQWLSDSRTRLATLNAGGQFSCGMATPVTTHGLNVRAPDNTSASGLKISNNSESATVQIGHSEIRFSGIGQIGSVVASDLTFYTNNANRGRVTGVMGSWAFGGGHLPTSGVTVDIRTNSNGSQGVNIKPAAAGQTSHLLVIQDSSSGHQAGFDAKGFLGLGLNNQTPLANLDVRPSAVGTQAMLVQSLSSQTSPLATWRDSSGVVQVVVGPQGFFGAGPGNITPRTSLDIQGSVRYKRVTTSTNYSVLVSDYIVGVNNTSAARTITLPLASTCASGQTFIIADESGGAATNNITIARSGLDTIDGGTSKIISINYGARKLYSDGINAWYTASDSIGPQGFQGIAGTSGTQGFQGASGGGGGGGISIGDTVNYTTGGSILFVNGSSLAQDNANFYWDDTNNYLGIGTNSPKAPLGFPETFVDKIRLYGNNDSSSDRYGLALISGVMVFYADAQNTTKFSFRKAASSGDPTNGAEVFAVYQSGATEHLMQSASSIGIKVKVASSPTANAIEVQNSSNASLSCIGPQGYLGIGTGTPIATSDIRSIATNAIVLQIRSRSSQTANLVEIQDSSGAVLNSFDKDGYGFPMSYRFNLEVGSPATTGTNKSNILVVERACKVTKAFIVAKTGPSGSALICDINKGGTSIWNTNQSNRIQIASGSTSGTSTSFDTTTFSEGDQLTVDIDQVGSSTAGQDITVQLLVLAKNQ